MSVADLTGVFLQGLGEAATRPLGLGVSGGGDSMAMLHLAVRAGLTVRVATVDHGLRHESAAEAGLVADVCAGLGVPHQVLRWQGWDGRGNLQDRARRARRMLLGEWAQTAGLTAVGLAHTEDDLAETLLMRLARGAGVDGLAAMAPAWHQAGVMWLRPLLAVSRQALRDYLIGLDAAWVDDPSNRSDRFDRARARKALTALTPLGMTSAGLAAVAQHLAEARSALEVATDGAAARQIGEQHGILRIAGSFSTEPAEIQRRLLQRAIMWMVPNPYGPRGEAVQGLRARLATGKAAQLAGCHFLPVQGEVIAFREARATGPAVKQGEVWDGCWQISGPEVPDGEIRALGAAGLAQIQDWRSLGLPRAALLSQPALWRREVLVAAPALTMVHPASGNWRAIHAPAALTLYHSVLSH